MELSDTLFTWLDVDIEPFALCDVHRGHQLALLPDTEASVHYVLQGNGWLRGPSDWAIRLEPDTMVIVPRGLSQSIEAPGEKRSGTAAPLCLRPQTDIAWLRSSGQASGDDLVLACGRLRVSCGADTELFQLLEAPLMATFDDQPFVRASFELMLNEFCHPRLGTGALTATLMKQSLILMLRRLHESGDDRVRWLAVLEHRGLRRVVHQMLSAPERPWRVEELADMAAMSRSAFAEHFARTVGRPPHEFLAAHRLGLAARLLQTSDQSVETIATRVGFKSRSSFSRAFRARFDIDPLGYRAAAVAGDVTSPTSS